MRVGLSGGASCDLALAAAGAGGQMAAFGQAALLFPLAPDAPPRQTCGRCMIEPAA